MCDFQQGPDFKGIELPNCERIVSVDLGGVGLGVCEFGRMDGFDNLLYEAAVCGDMDEDRQVSVVDITIFVEVLLGLDADVYHRQAADISLDGVVDGVDIQPFVDCVVP